jgi:general secretion pathway protein G
LYLAAKEKGGYAKAEPEQRVKLARILTTLTEMYEKQKWHYGEDQAIHWCTMAKQCLGAGGDKERVELGAEVDRMLVEVTRKEIGLYIKVFENYYKRDFGEYPPGTPGGWEKALRENRYTGVDETRRDKEGRLCDGWGNPYRYLNPGRHGGAVEMYSFGANGKDEEGGGDDITSWGTGEPQKN